MQNQAKKIYLSGDREEGEADLFRAIALQTQNIKSELAKGSFINPLPKGMFFAFSLNPQYLFC
jgi:hypothetical protein